MKLTRHGICYNLKTSPYKHIEKYDDMEVVFAFSSQIYIPKFEERQKANRDKINASLANRFGVAFENNLLSDIMLYSKVESRGFYLTINGEEFECLSNLKLNGVKKIQKN